MNGKEAIINKIVSNAEERSKEILRLAEAQAEQILQDAKARAKAIGDTAAVSASSKADVLYENKVTVATRQAKNVILLAKQKILDEVFDEARRSIEKLPADEYKKFIGGLILKYAENDDSIVAGKEDKKIFTADFVTGLTSSKKVKLSISKDVANFDRGVLLSNKTCDKNLSLDMLARVTRETSEAAVAKLCFEVK